MLQYLSGRHFYCNQSYFYTRMKFIYMVVIMDMHTKPLFGHVGTFIVPKEF
jgi:hypothetical protein